MTKKAFMTITREALEDLLRFAEKDINIDGVSNMDNNEIRIELSGNGLPVSDGSLNEQVKTRYTRKMDGDGDKSAMSAPVFAKRHDSFPN